jgi:uncharacterized lipoprotein NlpE involved in copper resistance
MKKIILLLMVVLTLFGCSSKSDIEEKKILGNLQYSLKRLLALSSEDSNAVMGYEKVIITTNVDLENYIESNPGLPHDTSID